MVHMQPHLHNNIELGVCHCDREQLNLVFEWTRLLCTVWIIEDSCAKWAVSHDCAQKWFLKGNKWCCASCGGDLSVVSLASLSPASPLVTSVMRQPHAQVIGSSEC